MAERIKSLGQVAFETFSFEIMGVEGQIHAAGRCGWDDLLPHTREAWEHVAGAVVRSVRNARRAPEGVNAP